MRDDDRMMKRRRFLSVCSLAGVALAGVSAAGQAQSTPPLQQQPAPARRRYRIEVEIVECKAGRCAAHKLGDRFAYPADRGRMCPWLLDSMNSAIRVLEYGGTMPWLYEGTAYKKVIDPDGVTTEFIRCPDPTDAGVVVKITRTKV
jgi:uncharacterized repeat protein (TIGR04076 family)